MDNKMEDNKETGKDKQDAPDNDPTSARHNGEDSNPPSLEEEQNPGDNAGLQMEGPDDKEVQNPSENVELQAEDPGENIEHPSKDAELQTEGLDDNKDENLNKDMDLQTENLDVDKEDNVSEGLGLQLEDPDVTKEQNPSENVKLPIDDRGLVETVVSETVADAKVDANANGVHGNGEADGSNVDHLDPLESRMPHERSSDRKADDDEKRDELKDAISGMELCSDREIKEEVSKPELDEIKEELAKPELDVVKEEVSKPELDVGRVVDVKTSSQLFLSEPLVEGDESGSEEEQAAFMRELENFFKEKSLEFKPPKFYGEGLNLLKLWRAVTRLGGYDQVTSCKLWRQVGESFKPPKTCTTVSWTFRCFYEKALLEYEKHKMHGGELPLPDASLAEPISIGNQSGGNQATGSGRARRDAAARAMQGWHSQRLLGNGEVGDPIIKDKSSSSTPKREKQLKSIGLLKRKRPSSVERAVKVARMKATKPQLDTMVVDVGPPADWVKINVRKTKDCFEVYALVPGLLREEVRVQSDPAGRLVISGEPEQLDNPWGVTPFKKVVSLPSRIDPHQTSAVVTLHGQLFVRVPFEQSDL